MHVQAEEGAQVAARHRFACVQALSRKQCIAAPVPAAAEAGPAIPPPSLAEPAPASTPPTKRELTAPPAISITQHEDAPAPSVTSPAKPEPPAVVIVGAAPDEPAKPAPVPVPTVTKHVPAPVHEVGVPPVEQPAHAVEKAAPKLPSAAPEPAPFVPQMSCAPFISLRQPAQHSPVVVEAPPAAVQPPAVRKLMLLLPGGLHAFASGRDDQQLREARCSRVKVEHDASTGAQA